MPTGGIFNLFAESPIKPIQKHMEAVVASVLILPNFFQSVINEDWAEAEKLYKEINELENKGDLLKQDIRLHLPNSLFMPFNRTDLLLLLSAQDKMANRAKDIAGTVFGRKMVIPQAVQTDFTELLNRTIDAVKHAKKAINELDELVETGFKGKEATLVETMIDELDSIEQDTDNLQITLRAQMFKLEETLPPIEIMFIYKVIDLIGNLGNRAQRVGHRLQIMLAS